jgi:nucleoside-diphosphate-sugar epimerase
MTAPRRRVLILGATGVVGHAAATRFLQDDRFDVVTASRRDPRLPLRADDQHLALDLRDTAAVADALRDAGPITDVVYAALYEKSDLISGWVDRDQIATNRLMLANVLDGLLVAKNPVGHVSALQGTKAYGFHVQPMRVPAKESQPRVEHENFYWEQEDLLVDASARLGFSYTIFRPQFIFGGVIGAAMNLIPVLGTYAALCRELGRPFSFPGGDAYVAEAVDSHLLADALHWAADSEQARNETFNITNGDVFDWRDLWASFAASLEVETGPDEPLSLAEWLPAQREVWQRIVDRHDLQRLELDQIMGLSHQYADNAFGYTDDGAPLESRATPVLLSTVKLRQAGFGRCIDTEAMFAYWLGELRRQRIVP